VVECAACPFLGLIPTCHVTDVAIEGRCYERIRYSTYDGRLEQTCRGCGITAPNLHHAGCD
jgi:hypothetical protein